MHKTSLMMALFALSRATFAADFAPSVQWVKAIGGSGSTSVTAAAADSKGNLYVVGNTTSLDFPTTGATQPKPGGSTLVRVNLTDTSEQAVRIGQQRAKVKAEVHPIGMRGGEDERVTRSLREREVVGDGVHLVDELAGCRRFFEDQFSSGQCELLNRLAMSQRRAATVYKPVTRPAFCV